LRRGEEEPSYAWTLPVARPSSEDQHKGAEIKFIRKIRIRFELSAEARRRREQNGKGNRG